MHFHAVPPVDGPDGPPSLPPDWADVIAIDHALRSAISAVRLEVPDPSAAGDVRTVRFGGQVDTQVIHSTASAYGEGITGSAVAGYIAKYATKAAETTGAVSRRIRHERDVEYLGLSDHVTAMIRACFLIAGTPGFESVNPLRTAHMLGYGGRCTTKSRRYSVTFGVLRGSRRAYRDEERRVRLGLPSHGDRKISVKADWTFHSLGLRYGEGALDRSIRRSRMAVHVDA